jgi:SAM-dependent methyltransferase
MSRFGKTYWRRWRNRLLRKHVRLEGKVFDLGSGWRVYSENAIRLDLKPDFNPNVVSDIQKGICFADSRFDTVLMFDVLEHLEYPNQALEEVKRIIKKGGTPYLTVPFCFPRRGIEYYSFSDLALRKMLEGFEIEIIPVKKSKFWNLIWNYHWQDVLVEGYFPQSKEEVAECPRR